MARLLRDLRTLRGFVSAVPTPFRDGEVDTDAFAAFCDRQVRAEIAGLVVCGTTGEAPALADVEQRRLIRVAVATSAGRVPVIAGVGANGTARSIELARAAEEEGADGLLVVTPYYNKPPQEGLYRHFAAVHDATRLPVILYDVPARTGCQIAVETVVRLARLPRIVGIKEASGDLSRPRRIRERVGPSFRLLGGDDATALGFLTAGGDGFISVLSNLVPAECVRMQDEWETCDRDAARATFRSLEPLVKALFRESNPIPLKCALGLEGLMSEEVRLPLCPASAETRTVVAAALADRQCLARLMSEEAAVSGAYT